MTRVLLGLRERHREAGRRRIARERRPETGDGRFVVAQPAVRFAEPEHGRFVTGMAAREFEPQRQRVSREPGAELGGGQCFQRAGVRRIQLPRATEHRQRFGVPVEARERHAEEMPRVRA